MDMKNLIQFFKDNFPNGVTILSSQFDRDYPLDYEYIPETKEEFETIIEKAPWDILRGLGFGKWEVREDIFEPDVNDVPIGQQLFLLPGEWYDIIPNGYKLISISGKIEYFKKGKTDSETRFGCLAFGIIRGDLNENKEVKPSSTNIIKS